MIIWDRDVIVYLRPCFSENVDYKFRAAASRALRDQRHESEETGRKKPTRIALAISGGPSSRYAPFTFFALLEHNIF